MATFKKQGEISYFREKMVNGMIKRGYDKDFALRCFRQIEGFGLWISRIACSQFCASGLCFGMVEMSLSDVFICALLNAQPMGFYAPSQLIAEAKREVAFPFGRLM